MDGSAPAESASLRLLVVEDEAMIAMMLEDILQELGHRVVDVATSVEAALGKIEDRAGEIDGAVLDANLGGAPAAPVAAALREAGIRFVVASGYDGSDLQRLGFEEPCIRKPYQLEEVGRALQAIGAG